MMMGPDEMNPEIQWTRLWSAQVSAPVADDEGFDLDEVIVDEHGRWSLFNDIEEIRAGKEASAAEAKLKVLGELAAIVAWSELAEWRWTNPAGTLVWTANIWPNRWELRFRRPSGEMLKAAGRWDNDDIDGAKAAVAAAVKQLQGEIATPQHEPGRE